LTEVIDGDTLLRKYSYDGLGNRVEQRLKRNNKINIEKIDYVLDLTRPCKNVLERKVNENHE